MAERTCSMDGCPRAVRARGWCISHYNRWQVTGSPRGLIPRGSEPRGYCTIDGCDRVVQARGWCSRHYSKWRRWGSPEGSSPRRIRRPPIERFERHVDRGLTDGGCWLWIGSVHQRGYGHFWLISDGKRRSVRAHRWAYEHYVGPIPEGLSLDHLCHTNDSTCPGGVSCPHRRCVNPAHLEPVTARENMRRAFTRGDA